MERSPADHATRLEVANLMVSVAGSLVAIQTVLGQLAGAPSADARQGLFDDLELVNQKIAHHLNEQTEFLNGQ